MGEIGSLSRDAMAEPRDENQGSPQALAMENVVKGALSLSGSNPFHASVMSPHQEKLRDTAGYASRPGREFCVPYLDRFLDHVTVMFFHINSAEIKNCFDAFFDAPDSTAPILTDPYCDFHVYMAMAIGMSLSPDPGIELLATSWHNSAIRSLEFISKDSGSGSFDFLRCIFLLVIYSIYNPFGGSTWHLLGLAMKKSMSLRLHREPEADIGTPETINNRRRFFWSLYTLDRLVSCQIPIITKK